MALKPLNDAQGRAPTQIINRLRPKLNRLPVASAFLQAAQDLRIGGRSSNALYQYTLQADNVQDLVKWGPILLAQMKKLPGFQDVNTDQQKGGLDEDADLRSHHGRSARPDPQRSGHSSLQRLRPGRNLGHLYPVEPVLRGARGSASVLAVARRTELYLSAAATGQPASTPLSAVSTAQAGTTPLQVNHTGVFPSVTVSFNLAPGLSLSDATLAISEMQAELGMPSTIHGFFAGTLEAYQQSLSTEPILVTTALLAVYIVLGILYESLVHPLTIISTLPPASVGAMLALHGL